MNFKRKMGLLSIIFAVCMVFGLFPATVSASDSDDNPVDIINHILNGENKGEITERLQNIDKSDLDFLFDKLEDLINANDSIVPAVTKEKLLSYGINSTTTEAFLQDVFGSDGVISNQASWDAFVDAFENNRVFDEGSDKGLLTYYTDLNEAFTDNFPQAKDALKLYDLIDLSDAALAIISLESFDPFNPSTEDKEAINDAIDSISTDLKDKLKLYGIDWVAYHQAIQTALSEGIITESDKLKIKSILGFTVIINPVDVTIDDGKAEVSLPDFPTTSDGKTEAVTVPITISSQVSALLGLPAGSTVEIALPSLQLESGQTAPTITLAPIPAGITTGSRPAEEILTVEITVSGLAQGQTVTLSLPIPSGLSNPGAFHWNGSRWEYREATVKGNVIEFDTDLSPVLIGEAVDAPTNLTAASTTSSSVTLQWNSAFSGATYEVYQGDTKVGETRFCISLCHSAGRYFQFRRRRRQRGRKQQYLYRQR